MTEKPSGINIKSLESKHIIGKVEKTVEHKIIDVAVKLSENKVFSVNTSERETKTTEILRSEFGVDSYEEMLSKSQDVGLPEATNLRMKENIDILSKSISMVMNSGSDQELQTRVNLGASKVEEVLPRVLKTESDSKLSERVMDMTVRNPKIREIYREIDSIRQDFDLDDSAERKAAADLIAKEREKIMGLRSELKSEEKDEWILAKEYIKLEVANLDGSHKPNDGSIDAIDAAVIQNTSLEKIVESMSKVVEKMDEVVEKTSTSNNNKDVDLIDDDYDGINPNDPAYQVRTSIGEDGKEMFEGGYGPDMPTFVRKIIVGTSTDFRDSSPPKWYKDFTKNAKEGVKGRFGPEAGAMEQWKYRTISELANFSGAKLRLKDGDLESLAMKARPELSREEFKLLYEVNENGSGLVGFKESLEVFMGELFTFNKRTGMLELKNNGSLFYNENGKSKSVFDNFYEYEEYLAKNLSEKTGQFSNFDKDLSINEAKIVIGTAWNFLFLGDTVESADTNRVLNPGKAYGDKVALMFHPNAKFLRKFRMRIPGAGMIKNDKNGNPDFNKMTVDGSEEPFGGSYGDWWYNKISKNPELYKDIYLGNKKVFPERLAMSLVESFPIYAISEGSNVPERMSMAQALMEKKTIITNPDQLSDPSKYSNQMFEMDFASDAPIMIRYRDIYQSAFSLLNITLGKVKYDSKDPSKWFTEFKTNQALIRQNKIGIEGGEDSYLSHVDDVDFLKVAIANSIGVNLRITETEDDSLFLTVGDNPDLYYTLVNNILKTPGLLPTDKDKSLLKDLSKFFNADKGIFASSKKFRKAILKSRFLNR